MRLWPRANPIPPIETPEEHGQNAEIARKLRNGLLLGGVAFIGVGVGIDVLNGVQETQNMQDILPYLPYMIGIGALVSVPVTHVSMKQEAEQARLGSQDSFT